MDNPKIATIARMLGAARPKLSDSPQLKRNAEMEKQLEEALLGIGLINMREKRVKYQFGDFNNRHVNVAHVKALRENYESEGIDRFAHSIPILVVPSYIKLSTLVSKDAPRDKVTKIEFTPEADDQIIKALGGHHRSEAMAQLEQIYEKMLVKLRKKYKPKRLEDPLAKPDLNLPMGLSGFRAPLWLPSPATPRFVARRALDRAPRSRPSRALARPRAHPRDHRSHRARALRLDMYSTPR